MKIDPKITLGIGIGMIISSLFFLFNNIGMPSVFMSRDLDNELDKEGSRWYEEESIDTEEEELFEDLGNATQNDDINNAGIENEKKVKPGGTGDKELQAIIVEISDGMAADEVSILLEEYEIIDDAETFVDHLLTEEKITDIRPGEYEFSPHADKSTIVDQITRGPE